MIQSLGGQIFQVYVGMTHWHIRLQETMGSKLYHFKFNNFNQLDIDSYKVEQFYNSFIIYYKVVFQLLFVVTL